MHMHMHMHMHMSYMHNMHMHMHVCVCKNVLCTTNTVHRRRTHAMVHSLA